MAADLLLFAFYYPPFPGVGARRWGFLSRFLSGNGYSVSVVTAPSPHPGAAEAPAAGRGRIAVHPVAPPSGKPPRVPRLPFVEEWLAWQRPFRESAEALIERERPRLMAFTGGPFFYFGLAPVLGKRFAIPYWLDFRDAWDLGSHAPLRFSAPLVRHLERRAIRNARMVTDVTPEMSTARRAAFPGLPPERFQVLENGYDGSPIAAAAPPHAGPTLRLGIWGKFSAYDAGHPALLLKALAETAKNNPVELHHCGDAEGEKALIRAAADSGLAHALRFHGFREYEDGLAFMSGMDLMVVSHRSPLMVGTKVYDAVRLNKPVLAIVRPGDALARMVRPFRHAYLAATAAEAAAALGEFLRSRPARLDPGLDPEPYSRLRQAQKFLPRLEPLLGPPRAG